MSNPFYARYIPGKTGGAAREDSALGKIETSSPVAVADAGATKKRKRQKTSHSVNGNVEDREIRAPNGRSNRKDNELRESASINAEKYQEEIPVEHPVEETPPDLHANAAEHEKQGKRKKKKKAGSDLQKEGDDDASYEAAPKHASIFSKFRESIKKSSKLPVPQSDPELDDLEQAQVNDLTPLPQPRQPEEKAPSFVVLPSWLAEPIHVDEIARADFTELGLDDFLIKVLQKRNLHIASAVQSAVLPMLLPTPRQHPGDLCISAATGSGKTLSYALPIVQSLKNRKFTSLKALVIVPTRELVAQVRDVFQYCTAGISLGIGTMTSNQPFKTEQAALIEVGRRYDPKEHARVRRQFGYPRTNDVYDDIESDYSDLDEGTEKLWFGLPQDYALDYKSKCDILICTPGRLVDHIKSTRGLSLADLEWLIIDEADRLLEQSFQEWVVTVLRHLETPRHRSERQKSSSATHLSLLETRHVRKVILSATMTKDLDKLQTLKLRYPKSVVVRSQKSDAPENDDAEEVQQRNSDLTLPSTLEEYAIPVGDGSERPLYLLRFLHSHIFVPSGKSSSLVAGETNEEIVNDDSDSDSTASSEISGSSSSSSSASSLSDSLGTANDDSSSTPDLNSDSDSDSTASDITPSSNLNAAITTPSTQSNTLPLSRNILIFTNSTNSATRLAHLLALLEPSHATAIGCLTKIAPSTPSSTQKLTFTNPKQSLKAFKQGELSILIATDRAARGLDIPNLTDVLNYDMPRSAATYVHRVGRTARAGRAGHAWTLFSEPEGWFYWNHIARGTAGNEVASKTGDGMAIARTGKVARVHVSLSATQNAAGQDVKELRRAYKVALEQLERDVRGNE